MNRSVLVFLMVLEIMLGSTILNANEIATAIKVYRYDLRKGCRMSGINFAHKYTREEWQDYAEIEDFRDKVAEMCPKLDVVKIPDSKMKLIQQFVNTYPKDNPVVPVC